MIKIEILNLQSQDVETLRALSNLFLSLANNTVSNSKEPNDFVGILRDVEPNQKANILPSRVKDEIIETPKTKRKPRTKIEEVSTPTVLTIPQPPIEQPPLKTFENLLIKITELIQLNKITSPQMIDICQKHGINTLPLLATMPEKIPVIWDEIDHFARV